MGGKKRGKGEGRRERRGSIKRGRGEYVPLGTGSKEVKGRIRTAGNKLCRERHRPTVVVGELNMSLASHGGGALACACLCTVSNSLLKAGKLALHSLCGGQEMIKELT